MGGQDHCTGHDALPTVDKGMHAVSTYMLRTVGSPTTQRLRPGKELCYFSREAFHLHEQHGVKAEYRSVSSLLYEQQTI